MRLLYHEILIANLLEQFPRGHEQYRTAQGAYTELKLVTNEDFGHDAEAWRRWFEENDFKTAFKGLRINAKEYWELGTKKDGEKE